MSGDAGIRYGQMARASIAERRGGAACVWRTPTPDGWTSRRFHLGTNKEVFNAEVFTIYRALYIFDQRQASGHRYAVFSDSTAAINRVGADTIGPASLWRLWRSARGY